MARKNRQATLKKLQYFFLNEKIHKAISVSRSKDSVIAWCYPDKKRMLYSYIDVKKNMNEAYTIKQVGHILNKHRVTIQEYILKEKILSPQKIYPIGNAETSKWYQYMFSEKDILSLHEYILDSAHSKNVPSRSELVALLKTNFILYTKTDSGFVPVWKAE